MSHELLFLSQDDVIDCGGMDMGKTMEDLEKVYRIQDQGDYIVPDKTVLKWPGENSEEVRGRINAMASYVGGDIDYCGIKWIGSGPNNPFKHNLPRASALIVLNDPVTMVPLAVMDGAVISAMRTGAVTGISSKYLSPSNPQILSLFGAGVQNRTQLLALVTAQPSIKTVRVFDSHVERSQAFAREMSALVDAEIIPVETRTDMFNDCDIIVTATTAVEPLVYAKDIEKGCYLAHVGGHEVEDKVVLQANKIVVDDWEILKHRGGDTLSDMAAKGQIGDDDIYASVQELVVGKKAPRKDNRELTYTCSVGLGSYDVAVAARIYREAKEQKKGTLLKLWDNPNWI